MCVTHSGVLFSYKNGRNSICNSMDGLTFSEISKKQTTIVLSHLNVET